MKILIKILKITGIVVLVLIIGIVVFVRNSKLFDKHAGYKLDLTIRSSGDAPIRTGFAALTITPEIPDRWHDNDNNAKYEPDKGDTYDDLNGNGKFDAYWLAGFARSRAANGINDDIWARTMIIDDGKTRLALVSVDVIGITNTMLVDIRGMLPERSGISYLTISSTHTHEAPDMTGPWGHW